MAESALLSQAEAEALRRLATDRTVLELGTYLGGSAILMATTAKRVYTVDTCRGCADIEAPENQEARILACIAPYPNVVFGRDDWRTVRRGGSGSKWLTVETEMAFLDAEHDHDSVAEQLAWMADLRMALVCVHDYHHKQFPGVVEAVNEFRHAHPEYDMGLVETLAILTRVSNPR